MADNEVYQYSIISALMDGVASNGIPISRILEHGDHGLGTFLNMVGEMIIIDGVVYQMKADGSIVYISNPADTITPFAMTTRFRATATSRATVGSKSDLAKLLTRMFPAARNHFVSIRMDGVFKSVRVRTAGGQLEPREKLPAVAARQTTHTFENVKGTIIGFRSPQYIMGINVAGDHMHFISEDRQRGGHILGFETEGDVDFAAAHISKFHMELPTGDDDFDEAALVGDAKGIAAVEG